VDLAGCETGGAVLGTGIWLLRTGARLREADARRALQPAERRAARGSTSSASSGSESERALNETSRALGYRDSIELIRDWNEYVRLSEESTPVLSAQESLSSRSRPGASRCCRRQRRCWRARAAARPIRRGSSAWPPGSGSSSRRTSV
jgi:hypothetical protein